MRRAVVKTHEVHAGILEEIEKNKHYRFVYRSNYQGPPISLTIPVSDQPYEFDQFPPFFDGLLPEGVLLESLLRTLKLDRTDHFAQLIAVGQDLVGMVTLEEGL